MEDNELSEQLIALDGELWDYQLDKLVQFIKERDERREAEIRINTANILKARSIKHFTKWGGSQGNCTPQDTFDDYIASCEQSLKQSTESEGSDE